jgi:hypothetical protein
MDSEPSTSTLPNGNHAEEEKKDDVAVKGESEDVEMKDVLEEGASEVIYINNLNEKIKLDGKTRSPQLLFLENNTRL